MNRLEQDAADALEAYEFQRAERERWTAAQPQKIVGTVQHFVDEQARLVHQAWIEQHEVVTPF